MKRKLSSSPHFSARAFLIGKRDDYSRNSEIAEPDTLSYQKARLDKPNALFYQKARLDKNLTSFLFLPFGFWLAPKSLNRPLFALLSGRFSRTHFVSSHLAGVQNKTKKTPLRVSFCFIGIARFELTTSCSRSKRSTRLSYIPVTRTIIVNFCRVLKGSLPKKLKKFAYFFFLATCERGLPIFMMLEPALSGSTL